METDTLAPFRLTDRAAARIAEIMEAQSDAAALRVEVLAGGCSGFQYKFDLARAQAEDDVAVAAASILAPGGRNESPPAARPQAAGGAGHQA